MLGTLDAQATHAGAKVAAIDAAITALNTWHFVPMAEPEVAYDVQQFAFPGHGLPPVAPQLAPFMWTEHQVPFTGVVWYLSKDGKWFTYDGIVFAPTSPDLPGLGD